MDAIELLEHDHRIVEQLFRDCGAAKSDKQRRAVADVLIRELSKLAAPTRPHPGAPDRPPALTLAAPVAAVYDRLRDRLQGRPET